MNDTPEQLRRLACHELGMTEHELDLNASFAELGLDSLMLVDFMFSVEDKFGIQIDHDQAMATPTLAGLITLVSRLRAELPAAAAAATPLAA